MRSFTIASLIFSLLFITGTPVTNAQRITVTVAGDGTPAFNGDGNAGVSAQVSNPYDVCADAANNIYFTDMGNMRVRKVSAKNGMVTTIAGGGSSAADGIPGLSAALIPRNICADAAGNVYVVDTSSNRIRRIDAATDIITTVAGTGSAGYSGDGGAATAATFSNIQGICIDNVNNIYLVDSWNNRIRKIAAGTGIVTTVAGTGAGGYSGDGGPAVAAAIHNATSICVNAAGDIFFADQSTPYTARIRKISAMTGIISPIAGIGSMGGAIYDAPALATTLGFVTGLCMDPSGNLDCNEVSCSCRQIDLVRDSVFEIAGNFGIESFSDCLNSPLSNMNNPYGLCADAAGTIYIADRFNNRVRKIITLTHTPSFAYGHGQLINLCSSGTTATINTQMGITDLDLAQPETWTVVTGPANGSLSGFPYTTASAGTDSVTFPTGLSYTPVTGFTGTDSFRVKVTDGVYSDVATIYISIGTPAGIVSSASSSAVCDGSSVYFSESVPGGLWSVSNSNASVQVFSGMVSGLSVGPDTLIYTVSNSCGTTVARSPITINNCSLGVNPVSATEQFSLFPNPASSVLNITWTSREQLHTVAVTDLTGRELLTKQINSNGQGTTQMDISNLPAGVYFIKIDHTETRKFVKE
jgi:hypothetical protein